MAAGLIGVPLGSGLAQRLRPTHATCDPLICAFGLIASAPFVYLGLVVAPYSTNWCFFFVFLAEVTLNLCWSIVADMLLVSGWVTEEIILELISANSGLCIPSSLHLSLES